LTKIKIPYKKQASTIIIIIAVAYVIVSSINQNEENVIIEDKLEEDKLEEDKLEEDKLNVQLKNTSILPKLVFLKSIGSLGNGEKQFDEPEGIDIFNDKLYVIERNNHRIQVFSEYGEFISTIPLQVIDPIGIAVTENKFFVTDIGDRKIKIFNHNGDLTGQFGVTWTADLEADEKFVYVIEALLGKIIIYDHNGNVMDELQTPEIHYLNSNDKKLITSGPGSTQVPSDVLIFDKQERILLDKLPTSKDAHGAAISDKYIFLIDDQITVKMYDIEKKLLFEYKPEIISEDSFFVKIKINNDLVYIVNPQDDYIEILQIVD